MPSRVLQERRGSRDQVEQGFLAKQQPPAACRFERVRKVHRLQARLHAVRVSPVHVCLCI